MLILWICIIILISLVIIFIKYGDKIPTDISTLGNYISFYVPLITNHYLSVPNNNSNITLMYNTGILGNYLCYYFTLVGKQLAQGQDAIIENIDEKLPLYSVILAKDYPQIVQSLKELNFDFNIDPTGTWVITDIKKQRFWDIMKPLIQKILNEAFTRINLNMKTEVPVIHFRCSDVPFVKHPEYHFSQYKYYLDILKKTDYKKVILLSCHQHLSNEINKNTCDIYNNDLKQFLNDNGYEVEVKCQDIINDFSLMFYAPIVISPGSSFSFISGYCGFSDFYSSGHIHENNRENTCHDCSWLNNKYILYHNDIEDYHNTNNVISILRN